MTDRELVDALRDRLPGAAEALYGTYGAGLYLYCWFMLRNRENAQAALRDAMVLADAHIARLDDPWPLRPWLYALARAECQRYPATPVTEPDEPIARPDQRDADTRLIAWNAVMSLSPAEREALDLAARHGMEPEAVALVTGSSPGETDELLAAATYHLKQAVAATILVNRASYECAGRTRAMQGWAGTLTAPLRERIMRHAASCQVCASHLPREVSAARVFSVLPCPPCDDAVRAHALGCLRDPGFASYRALVAGRLTAFDTAGFPAAAAPPAAPALPRTPGRAREGRLAAVLAAAGAVAAVIAAVSMVSGLGTAAQGPAARGPRPATASGAPQAAQGAGRSQSPATSSGSGVLPGPAPQPAGTSGNPVFPAGWSGRKLATRAHGARQAAAPPRTGRGTPHPPGGTPHPPGGRPHPPGGRPRDPSPSLSRHLQVNPTSLSLGTGSYGRLVLTAEGGTVTWTASTTPPDVSISGTSGTLTPGQSATLTVTVSRRDGTSGDAVITISTGGQAHASAQVEVSWAALSSPSPPPSPPGPISSSYPPSAPIRPQGGPPAPPAYSAPPRPLPGPGQAGTHHRSSGLPCPPGGPAGRLLHAAPGERCSCAARSKYAGCRDHRTPVADRPRAPGTPDQPRACPALS